MNKLTLPILIACLAFFMEGCHKERLPLIETGKGVPVSVKLDFKVAQLTMPTAISSKSAVPSHSDAFKVNINETVGDYDLPGQNTKATTEPLYNLWVFQFDKDQKKRKAIKIETSKSPVDNRISLEVELFTGIDQTIYLLSLGKQYGEIDLTAITNIKELEATTFDFVRYEKGLPVPIIKNEADVPYRGSCSGITIMQLENDGKGYIDYNNSPNFSGAIRVESLVSLVTFDFTYEVADFKPFSIQLNNVPTTFTVNDENYKTNQLVNLPAVLFNDDEVSGVKNYTVSWYVAPNRQGTVTGLKETDRYFYYLSNAATGKAPSDGTYIHFWASDIKENDRYALYYIFLGGNTNDDFNILPHSHYKYKTHINNADGTNDKRIVFKKLLQSVDFAVSENIRGGYIPLLSADASYDLDTHADMRPIEITALRGTFSVDIIKASDDLLTISAEESWLKLSTFPTYTSALNNFKAGSPSALATKIDINVVTPGVFRLYLYSDEYEEYVNDNPSAHKRSLFVRFTFNTGDISTSKTYVSRMDQRPGFYMGQLGGKFDITNDKSGYTEGLALESTQEYSARYLSYYPSSRSMPVVAYRGALSTPDIIKVGAFDIYDGRQTTISMAENRYNFPKISKDALVQKPNYIGNYVDENNYKIDLYQYKYYTNDGFAQRYCYDKNRDKDGNGRLTDDEIVWYMPSWAQVISHVMNFYTTQIDYYATQPIVMFPITLLYSSGTAYVNTFLLNSTTTGENIRCVRNIPIKADSPGGVICYEEDGYAVIDASSLRSDVVENRVKNPDFIGEDGRVKRYYHIIDKKNASEEKKVSVRFRVAPKDIDKDGNVVDKRTYMSWAEAAGYNTAVNTAPITSSIDGIADTGCPVYKGNNSVEKYPNLGKWRLPTLHELNLITMMDQAMEATKIKTGYERLYIADSGFPQKYFTTAELADESRVDEKNRVVTISRSAQKTEKNYYNEYLGQYILVPKASSSSDYNTSARCVQDLPPK